MAKIRKRYNQVPHLTQDTILESNKNTINITNKSQEVSPFPAGDHIAVMTRRERIINTKHTKKQKPSFPDHFNKDNQLESPLLKINLKKIINCYKIVNFICK